MTENLVFEPSDEFLRRALNEFPPEIQALALRLRRELKRRFKSLREKYNTHTKYLGYAKGTNSDALYVHIQKSKLVLDIRVARRRAAELRRQGLQIRPRNNYQGRAGWLTGVCVLPDTDRLEVIVNLAVEALAR